MSFMQKIKRKLTSLNVSVRLSHDKVDSCSKINTTDMVKYVVFSSVDFKFFLLLLGNIFIDETCPQTELKS